MSLAEVVRLQQLDAGGEIGEVFYHCFACLHCRTHCVHSIDVPGALVEARKRTLACGGEPAAVSAVVGKFRDLGNPWGEDLEALLRAQVPDSLRVPEARAAVFPGCQTLRLKDQLPKVFGLLDRLEVDYVAAYPGSPTCCGAPLWQAGDHEGFVQHARTMRSRLAGYRTIICTCPTCAWVLRALYADVDLQPGARILHLSEFVEPLIGDRAASNRVSGPYVYHDPCYLTRYLEQPEIPRRLLERVLAEPLREGVWSGEDASCCGGGGLVPHVLPEVAVSAAGRRMRQLKESGAARVVTACPGCQQMLRDAPGALPVVDLVDLLLEAF